ncbi:MAG: serine hydrolase [Candidatus Binatia bacterium]
MSTVQFPQRKIYSPSYSTHSVGLLIALLALIGASAANAENVVVAARGADLRAVTDPGLQQALRRYIGKLDLERATSAKRLAVSLVDVTDPASPRLAMINGDQMMYAASLPKIAILLGAFQKIHDGGLRLNDGLQKQLTDMIRFSSDTAATDVLDLIGREYLIQVLQYPRYRLYDASMNGGLWVGKTYASGTAYRRDPLHNLSHGATAFQVARFYYLLETGQLVSPEYSRQMKQIMGSPGIRHKFVAGLESVHPDARVFRKSGTWRNYHADSAIIERAGRRYIAVALAEDAAGGEWLRKLIVAMDDVVFSQATSPRTVTIEQ